MVTTKQILAAAKKKGTAIGKQKLVMDQIRADIKKQRIEEMKEKKLTEARAIKTKALLKAKKIKKRAATEKKIFKEISKKRGRLKSSPIAKGIAKTISGAFSRAMQPLPATKMAPTQRRVVVRRRVAQSGEVGRSQPAFQRNETRPQKPTAERMAKPTRQTITIKRLQHTKNLKRFLTPAEQKEVNKGLRGMKRFNAMQILRKKLKEENKIMDKANRRIIRQVDPFNSSRIIERKEVAKEAWAQ